MKSIIPGLGEKTTRKRLRELEEKAGTLPVVFALLFTEAIKITVAGIPIPFVPQTAWFHFLIEALKFLLLAIAVGMAYVFEAERREVIGMAKEKAQEKTEETKDKVGSVKSSPDYELDIGMFGKSVSCTFDFDKNKD